MRRRVLFALGAGTLIAPFGSFAQQRGKLWRIGFLGSESAFGFASRVEAFREGLRDLGYEEGKNLTIEFRWADGKNDRLPELAAELVRLNVDVLVTYASPAIRAAKQATTVIPIVMAAVADPVALGLIDSLARPGGNVTGSTFFMTELAAKRIQLLKDAFPRIKQVAVLFDPGNSANAPAFKAMETVVRSAKLLLREFAVRGPDEFSSAFASMVKEQIDAVVVMENPIFITNGKAIAQLAAKERIVSVGQKEFAEAGGLIGYGANLLDLYRRAAYFVDRILRGAKPADLPVEQPTKFDLVVNVKTARALGLKIPQSILLRAEKVIE